MKIYQTGERFINREQIVVIDQIEYEGKICPVGLVRFDGGRFMKVMFCDGQWIEHLTDWRIYNTVTDARRVSSEITQSQIEFADALANL